MKAFLTAVACVLVAACATAPRGPAPLNPVGTYEFSTVVDGAPFNGTMNITGAPGQYGGTVTSSMMPQMPVTGVTVEGQVMTVTVDAGGDIVTLHLTFTGDNFTGHWEMGGEEGGDVTGRRVPAS